MEITTLIGIAGGAICIVVAIILSGSNIMDFVHAESIFIVFGGTIFATVAAYPMEMIKSFITIYKTAFFKKEIDLEKDIALIVDIANVARREGLLALEDAVNNIDSPFFKKGVMLVVDGADPELIKSVLEAEIYFVQERHAKGQAMLETMAAFAPAFGMVGTLIGLINMLGNLEDAATLGPNMSVALITTLYGVIIANLLCTPVAKKLKLMTAAETQEKELLLEGLLSIQDGENPRIIKDKLYAFIARKDIKDPEITGKAAETQEIDNG